MILLALVIGIAALGWWLVRRRPADRYADLVAQCHGDRAMAERLLAGEARRTPGRSRRDLVDHAISRLADDRRR